MIMITDAQIQYLNEINKTFLDGYSFELSGFAFDQSPFRGNFKLFAEEFAKLNVKIEYDCTKDKIIGVVMRTNSTGVRDGVGKQRGSLGGTGGSGANTGNNSNL
jgi:hypothetical protein